MRTRAAASSSTAREVLVQLVIAFRVSRLVSGHGAKACIPALGSGGTAMCREGSDDCKRLGRLMLLARKL